MPLDWATTQNNLGNALRDARASARAARRGWRRRSPPTAPRWRNGRASACRSTGRRRRTTSASRSATLGRARERHGAAGGGGRRLPRGAGGTDPRARAARLGDDAEQPRHRASDARASARAARRGWRRRSPPTAPRWRNGPASACRSTGRRRRTTSATRSGRSGERESGTARLEEAVAAYRAALEERTRERVPLDWAMTQNNLGIALADARRAGERHGAAGGGGRRLPRRAAGKDARARAARLGDDPEQSRQSRSRR